MKTNSSSSHYFTPFGVQQLFVAIPYHLYSGVVAHIADCPHYGTWSKLLMLWILQRKGCLSFSQADDSLVLANSVCPDTY